MFAFIEQILLMLEVFARGAWFILRPAKVGAVVRNQRPVDWGLGGLKKDL
jgi:hypothetical protein